MKFRLPRKSIWPLLGLFAFGLSQWLCVIVTARLSGPEALGASTLAMALVTPLALFTSLGLRAQIVTHRHTEFDASQFMAVRTGSILMTIVALIAIASLYPAHAGVILAFGAAKIFESISEIYYGLHQRHKDFDIYSKSMIARAAVGFLGFATILYLTRDIAWATFAMAISWGAVLMLYDVDNHILPPGNGPNREQIVAILRAGLPIGFAATLQALTANLPRYVLEHSWGIEAVGQFSALAYFVLIANILLNATTQVLTPHFSDAYRDDNPLTFAHTLRNALLACILLSSAAALGLVLLAPTLMPLLYGPQFALPQSAINLTALALILSAAAAILHAALTATRAFKAQAVVILVSVGVTLATSYLLIPQTGIVGAFTAWIAGLAAQAVLFHAALWSPSIKKAAAR